MKPWMLALIVGPSLVSATMAHGQAAPAPAKPNDQTAPAARQDYVLGAEDVVTVTVIRHPEFSGDFFVPASGIVQLPGVGDVDVRGLSLADLKKKVATKLDERMYGPEVNVTLRQARMQRFFVLGDVQHSGVFDLKKGWGVSEALSTAGGLSDGLQQSDVRVTLVRAATQETIHLTLDEALAKTGDATVRLETGDILRIEATPKLPVYVSGKVKTPGLYRLREDTNDVLAAIAEAGGMSPDASLGNVRIVHLKGGEEVVDLAPALVRGESTKLPRLAAGDMVIVSESLRTFAVLGYVAKPGNYTIPEGRSYNLSDAIALAEGADRRGRLTRIGLVRTENGKQSRQIYDLGKFLRNGDSAQNPAVQPGDLIFVPETDRAETQTIMSSLSSLAIFFNVLKR